jgi:hypothetical protein
MCDLCSDGEEAIRHPGDDLSPRIILRMRAFERGLQGEGVPDHVWAIFLGEASGSIAWPHYQRILESQAAVMAAPPPAIFCEAVPPNSQIADRF